MESYWCRSVEFSGFAVDKFAHFLRTMSTLPRPRLLYFAHLVCSEMCDRSFFALSCFRIMPDCVFPFAVL